MNRQRLILVLAAVALIAVAGIVATRRAVPGPVGPLTGSGVGGAFTLVDQDGRTVTDRSYAGSWRLMYFGYTYCPDVCPTDVQKLAQAMKMLDPATAAKVRPIFVTVDPARDTPAVVKTFVRAFSPTMVGLTGTPQQVTAALSAWKIYARKAGEGQDYLVDHMAMFFLMDPDNAPVSFLAHDATPATIAAEVEKYVP